MESLSLSHSLSAHNGTQIAATNWLYQTIRTTQRHFGAIEIDWSNENNPHITISLRTENNEIAQTKDWEDYFSRRDFSLSERFIQRTVGERYILKPARPLSSIIT